MGLSIKVGILAELLELGEQDALNHFEAQFAAVHVAIKAKKLPEHHEPTNLQGKQPLFC